MSPNETGDCPRREHFTFIFNDDDLALGFLSDAKTAEACTDTFRHLWKAADPGLFKALFAIVVTDNGPEFSDPVAIESNLLFVRRGEDGRRFLDTLGIVRVEPNEVRLTPSLLGEKFAQHAAHVILHRNKAEYCT